MEERGYGAPIALGIVVLALLASVTILVDVLDRVYDQLAVAQEKRDERVVNRIQTDIEIENVVHSSVENNLVVVVRNTGSVELDASKTDLLVDGKLIVEENLRSRTVDGLQTSVWLPDENLTITTENIFPTPPNAVKVVTEYGISDSTTEITLG